MGEISGKGAGKPAPVSVFGKVAIFLEKIMKPFTSLGLVLACTMIAAMMFLTFLDVGGRFVLNKPITGSLELTEFMMSVLASFGIGYCAWRKGHIRVDLILQYTSKKTTLWFDIFTYGISCLFYAVLTWQCWNNAFSQLRSHLTSSVLFIPVYPFVFLLVVGTFIITMILLKDTFQSIDEVRKL
jgi:TRAP-type C4-dicarboxylate transport system permease small subunit